VPTLQLTESQRLTVAEFATLYNEGQLWTPKQKRLKALGDTILSWYPDLLPAETELAVGTDSEVQIGARAIEKDWASMDAVCAAVGGPEALQAIADPTFKAVAGIIGNTAAAALQQETQTGHRKLKAVTIISVPRIELPKAA
jgi:hypothetical protein